MGAGESVISVKRWSLIISDLTRFISFRNNMNLSMQVT
jgi:hypothetical protein